MEVVCVPLDSNYNFVSELNKKNKIFCNRHIAHVKIVGMVMEGTVQGQGTFIETRFKRSIHLNRMVGKFITHF